jgi:hypothetical protein
MSNHGKYDPSMEKLKPGTKVGIVGESHVWDGPLNQEGRAHGEGSSSGIKGMQILKAPCRTCDSSMPITTRAKIG